MPQLCHISVIQQERLLCFHPNVTLRYVRVFAIANPSVVCNIRAPWVEIFRNICSPFCTS